MQDRLVDKIRQNSKLLFATIDFNGNLEGSHNHLSNKHFRTCIIQNQNITIYYCTKGGNTLGFGFKIKIWGDYGCFTRPEWKVERVSYDVITPSAARGILEAIYWKPEMRWVIDKIHVLHEIQFETIRRNEIKSKISKRNIELAMKGKHISLYNIIEKDRTQRSGMILKTPSYLVEAHFETIGQSNSSEIEKKHYNMALRRLKKGQFVNMPYFGCREFPAYFEYVERWKETSFYEVVDEIDLGWMLHDIQYTDQMTPRFYRAIMKKGVITIPNFGASEE